MVLELVTGGELFERIVEKTFYSESEAAKCVEEILRAVNELHTNGIVHRDLKVKTEELRGSGGKEGVSAILSQETIPQYISKASK